MTPLYPVFLRVDRLRCVVIGGGVVASRKIQGLLNAGARVIVVSPTVHPDVQTLLQTDGVEWIQREAREDDLVDADLAFLATSDGKVNSRLEAVARRHGVLVNRADSPEEGTFHVPAVLRRGDITVAVSTSGRGPGVARLIRDEIDSALNDEHVRLLDAVGEARDTAHAAGMRTSAELWRKLIHDDEVRSHIRAGRHSQAVAQILSRLESNTLTRSSR